MRTDRNDSLSHEQRNLHGTKYLDACQNLSVYVRITLSIHIPCSIGIIGKDGVTSSRYIRVTLTGTNE